MTGKQEFPVAQGHRDGLVALQNQVLYRSHTLTGASDSFLLCLHAPTRMPSTCTWRG